MENFRLTPLFMNFKVGMYSAKQKELGHFANYLGLLCLGRLDMNSAVNLDS